MPSTGCAAASRRSHVPAQRRRRSGPPSFRQVLIAAGTAYRDRRDAVSAQAKQLVDALRQGAASAPSREPLTSALMSEAISTLRSQFDIEWGGFGRAPKFPPASTIE